VGAYLVADIAHVAGLVASGVYPSPVPYADVITTTTHKTLRGPRGAMIMCKEEFAERIDKAVFPGLQGGPHNHITAGIAVALHEASTDEFKKYSDKSKMKHLVSTYDFFIAQASLMPSVATNFGRVLGPTGKMPSPQLGIILNADEKTINELKNKINTSIKIKVKEPSIKIPIGKQSMKDEDIIENVMSVYNLLLKTLPRNKENIKNIEIKFTMTKPYKIYLR